MKGISILFAVFAFFISAPANAKHYRHYHHYYHHHYRQVSYYPQQNYYLPHPHNCPARAFCGCGAAAHLGIADRSLWLAASWYKFPRSHPAPNTVAVRRHHVFVLKEDRGGGLWLVADYNSGGHLSRLHVRSLSGYTIVQPSYGNWGSQWSGYL